MYRRATLQLFFFSMLVFIFGLAWFLQAAIDLNRDASWLVEAAKRMLAGGHYSQDFFDNNPPWVLYFSIPPVLIQKFLPINITVYFRLYVFLLASISLAISFHFLRKIFSKIDDYLVKFFVIILAILFLIFPIGEFGQREHLLFILTMPYLCMMTLRLEQSTINHYLAFSVGLLAGSGFMLKPYFLMTFMLIELAYFIKKRSGSAFLRPEIIAIFMLLTMYAVILFTRHTDYLEQIIPFAIDLVYLGARRPWPIVFLNPLTIFCYLLLVFYLITYPINRYRQFTKILIISLLGFYVSYLLQQTDWVYHLLPALSVAILIYALLLGLYVSTSSTPLTTLWVVLFAVFLLIFINITTHLWSYYRLFHPVNLFFYMASMCLVILYLTSLQKCLTLTALIGVLLASAIFLLPVTQMGMLFKANKENKINYQNLLSYLNTHVKHHSINVFTTNLNLTFPIISDAEYVESASRFSYFWPIPGLVQQSQLPMDKVSYTQYLKHKNFMINLVAEDLLIKKPQWVFVDYSAYKGLYTETADKKIKIPFEYLTYFGENKKFSKAWENYHYVTTLYQGQKIYLNPFEYNLKLTYQNIPTDQQILENNLYVYLNQQGIIEVAFIANNVVKRVEVNNFAKIELKKFLEIKKSIATQGQLLSGNNKQLFFLMLHEQPIEIELYNLKVYALNA